MTWELNKLSYFYLIHILTHLHLDHIINAYLFTNAKTLCKVKGGKYSGQTHFLAKGCLKRTDLFDKTPIAEDVEVMLTPGHTEDMLSVLVRTPNGNVIITGDAFPDEEWIDMHKQPGGLYKNKGRGRNKIQGVHPGGRRNHIKTSLGAKKNERCADYRAEDDTADNGIVGQPNHRAPAVYH